MQMTERFRLSALLFRISKPTRLTGEENVSRMLLPGLPVLARAPMPGGPKARGALSSTFRGSPPTSEPNVTPSDANWVVMGVRLAIP